jgi:hypothetical protein
MITNKQRHDKMEEDYELERLHMEKLLEEKRIAEKKQSDEEFEDNMKFIEDLVYGKQEDEEECNEEDFTLKLKQDGTYEMIDKKK